MLPGIGNLGPNLQLSVYESGPQPQTESILKTLLTLTDKEILANSWDEQRVQFEFREIEIYIKQLSQFVTDDMLFLELSNFEVYEHSTTPINFFEVKAEVQQLMETLVSLFTTHLTNDQIKSLQNAIPDRPKFLDFVFNLAFIKSDITNIFFSSIIVFNKTQIDELNSLFCRFKELNVAAAFIDNIRKSLCAFNTQLESRKRNLLEIKMEIAADIIDPELKKNTEMRVVKERAELYSGKDKPSEKAKLDKE